MVKCQTDWNSYVDNLEPYEPYELEELDYGLPAMEVFALKFDFGERKQGYISGKITIKDEYRGVHMLLSTPTDDDFLLIKSGKFTQLMNGGTELPISGMTPVKIKLDLVDKSYGLLDFGRNYGFSGVEKEGGEKEKEEEEEEDEEEEEEEKKEEEEETEEEKKKKEEEYAAGEELLRLARENFERIRMKCDIFQHEEMTAAELVRAHQICCLWDDIGFSSNYSEKLLRRKVTCPCFSLEVMYAVYEDAMAVSVYVTFAEWNPSYFTGNSGGKRISRRAMSNGMHVYGQVTARNTLLTHPDATTTLFGKEIDELFHIKLGDLIPFLKTFVVIPRESSLLLDIDLRHVLPNAPLLGHKVPPSELFVKTTLEITNQNYSYNRFVVKDWGPAKLFVDVTWHRLVDDGMFY